MLKSLLETLISNRSWSTIWNLDVASDTVLIDKELILVRGLAAHFEHTGVAESPLPPLTLLLNHDALAEYGGALGSFLAWLTRYLTIKQGLSEDSRVCHSSDRVILKFGGQVDGIVRES